MPPSLAQSQVHLGAHFSGQWETMCQVETACVLVNASGATIGVVGSRGLSRADGVSLDVVDGQEVFNLCLSRISDNVHSLFFVAAPRRTAAQGSCDTPGMPRTASDPGGVVNATGSPAGPRGRSGLEGEKKARGSSTVSSALVFLASKSSGLQLETTPRSSFICRARVPLPGIEDNSGTVLMAFRSGVQRDEPWHVEALGRRVLLPETWQNGKGAQDIASIFSETLSHLAQRLQGNLPPAQDALPSHVVVAGGAAHAHDCGPPVRSNHERLHGAESDELAQDIAASRRLAGERVREADLERNRARTLQKALVQTQDSLRKTCGALSSLQYGLEAWRREALINAQGGEASKVVKMLPRLPMAPHLETLLDGDLSGSGMGPYGKLSKSIATPSPSTPPRGNSPRGTPPRNNTRESGRSPSPVRSPLESPRGDRLSAVSGGNLAGALDGLYQRSEQGAGEDGETFYSPGENPKTRTLKARASNPFNSRPPAATVGDVPLSLLDDEERQPLRELFFASGAQAGGVEGGAEGSAQQDGEQLPAGQPPPRLSRHQQAMQAAQRARAAQESQRNQDSQQQEQDDLALAQQLQEQDQHQQPQNEEAQQDWQEQHQQLPEHHDHLDQQRAFNSMHGQELIIESDIPPTPEMTQQYKWAPKEAGKPNPYANPEFVGYG